MLRLPFMMKMMYFSLYNMKFKYGFGIGMYYKYVGGYYVVDINFQRTLKRYYYLCVIWNVYFMELLNFAMNMCLMN